jgi:large subunit ribosomal protein L1
MDHEEKEMAEKKTKAVNTKEKVSKKPAEEAEPDTKEAVSKADEAKEEKKTIAKAGKRSEKGLKEAEDKAEKIEKQKILEDKNEDKQETKPKTLQKPPRSRLERRSKKYREAAKSIDKTKQYSLKEALDLAVKTSTTKFDSTVELHIRLNVDPKQADQNIRDNVVLPAGTGKSVRIAVYSDDQNVEKAKKAGADKAGADDFLAELDKEKIDFDVLIATPNVMQKLAKYARLLGPKGLMPNPKSGTVTADVEKAIKQAKAGKVEYRVDSYGIIHVSIGKTSFGTEKLLTNAQALLASVKQNKPSSLKGIYVSSINVATTMGPSVKVLSSEL